ncbi:large ribosomal subunit protein uL11m-like [Physella acuta]|uniref:large ribosomal subunit protein uL11m-like n=1 Tax=Physella acuta TaxID=109671 RepID=UPI0027DE717D|nr:large ribosomal subunit protein uL11m-like [Physella acuta]
MAAKKGAAKVIEKVRRKTFLSVLIPAGKATPAPPLGPELGQMQIQIGAFCKDFNEKTAHIKQGINIKTEITANSDRTYDLKFLGPPISYYLLQACGAQKGATKPGKQVCGVTTLKHVYEIAKIKKDDPTYACMTLQQLCQLIIGRAHNIGIQVVKGPLTVEELKEFQKKRADEVAQEEKELEELRLSKMLRL